MDKRVYELAVVLPASDEADSLKKVVEALLAKCKMEVNASDNWGEKTLTYPIRKHQEGVYIVYTINGTPTAAQKLKKLLQLESRFLRWLILAVKV